MRQSPLAIVQHLVAVFQQRFHRRPQATGVSPGRIEILGNHTDYNGGRILTATIDRYIVAVGARRTDNTIRVYAEAFNDETALDANMVAYTPQHCWSDYIAAASMGTSRAARAAVAGGQSRQPTVPGMDIVIGGDLPMGAGLSSSAALEAAVAMLLLHTAGIDCLPEQLAQSLQAGESLCAGVQCGLLDQYTVLCGGEDTLLVFDSHVRRADRLAACATPMAFLLINPHMRRELGGNAPYNQRREECEAAAAALATHIRASPRQLCRLPLSEYRLHRHVLPPLLRSRSRHVVMENQRVSRAVEALNAGDLARFGRLLNASHISSTRCFENSHPTLDRLQKIAVRFPGCLGCRLTGGGWGGCLLAVARANDADEVADRLRATFAKTPSSPIVDVFRCETGPAAHAFGLE